MRILSWFCAWLILSITQAQAVELVIVDPLIRDLEITVNASLSATTNYYLQGTLRSQNSSKYFGQTQNKKGDWIDYTSSPEKEFITSNFFQSDIQNASWSGAIKIRFKADDPNYFGPGVYDLKLRRFTGNSNSSAGDSNTLTVNLSAPLPAPTPPPSPSLSPSPSPPPTQMPSPSPSPSPRPSLKPSPSPSPSPPLDADHIGSVAGATTKIDLTGFGSSPSPDSSTQESSSPPPTINLERVKTLLLIGSGLLTTSIAGVLAYRKYRRSTIIPP